MFGVDMDGIIISCLGHEFIKSKPSQEFFQTKAKKKQRTKTKALALALAPN
jgi:hypothetical protein